MSRGPTIFNATFTVKATSEQKEEIRNAATKIGMNLGIFTRTAVLKEVARIKKAAGSTMSHTVNNCL